MGHKRHTKLDVAEHILSLLMLYRDRPGLYFGGPDAAALAGAWVAFHHMVRFLGYPDVFPRRCTFTQEVFKEHGWPPDTSIQAMKEAGLSEEEIFYEWIDVEIEALKRRIAYLKSEESQEDL